MSKDKESLESSSGVAYIGYSNNHNPPTGNVKNKMIHPIKSVIADFVGTFFFTHLHTMKLEQRPLPFNGTASVFVWNVMAANES